MDTAFLILCFMVMVWLLRWLPHNVLIVLCSMAQENRKGMWEVGYVHADVRGFVAMSSTLLNSFPVPVIKMSEMVQKGGVV